MSQAKVWVEQITIPTYEIGEAEKNPIFLDKRVYQGSSGKVYPYPTVEKISEKKTDKEYTAVWLEKLGRKKLEALTDQDPCWIWPVPPA